LIQVSLGNVIKESEIKEDKFHPEFEECFTFMIPKNEMSLDLVGKVEVIDLKKGNFNLELDPCSP